MRFQRLAFPAFGPFTGLELDLAGGAPGGFHMIFGPNEAGKTSALRGVRDLLFGFPERTPDAHVHPNAELRVRAALSAESGQIVEVQRLKRRKDSLRDAADLPIDESALSALLGGVDAPLFERLFGLDHERLRLAGEALLNDRGDVGESLFDAGSGGRSIRVVLEELERDADAIFKPRSSKASLNVLLETYKETKLITRESQVSPEKWLAQEQELEAARRGLRELGERRKKLREESNAQSRLDAVLGPIAERNALCGKLETLGALPLLADDASERRVRAQRTVDEAGHERARLEREIAKKEQRLAELVVPENLLGVSPGAIEELRDRVGKFRAAEQDLPRRREDARRHEAELERLVKLLYPGQPLESLEALRPSQTELSRMRRLPQRQAALLERVAQARKSLALLEVSRAQAATALRELPPSGELGAQRRALSSLRASGDIERRTRQAKARRDKLEEEARIGLSALGFFRGPLAALPGLELPQAAAVERFQLEFADRAARLTEIDREHAAFGRRLLQCTQKIKAIEASGSVPSEASLDRARAVRDDGLRRVFSAWASGARVTVVDPEFAPDLPLSEGLRRAVVAADEQADRLRREAERVSMLGALHAEHEQLTLELNRFDLSRAELAQQTRAAESAWQLAWRRAHIEPSSPSEMRAWLGRHARLVELSLSLNDAERELESLREECQALATELARSLGREPGAGEALGPLLALCEDAVELGARAQEKRSELLEALKGIDRQRAERELELAAECEALEVWQGEWRAATAKLGFPGDLSPDEVVTRLDSLSGLFDALVQLAEQRRRATRIEQDRAEFEALVSGWIQTYAPDLLGRAPDLAAEELVRRFQAAEHRRAEDARIQADLSELGRAFALLEGRAEQAEAELESLRLEAGAADLASLPAIEARVSEARGLRRELDAVEASLLKDEGVPLEALLKAARGVDRATLQVRLRELEEELERVDGEHQDLSARVRDLDAGLARYADTDAADYAQGQSVQAAEIRTQALRYAKLKLSAVVLRREVERYREQNQGPVLRRASALFPRLTLGRFQGLRAGMEERQIIALRDDGKEVTVDGLSEGTRYQLYLALRIASLERYLLHNPSLPLLLDDILIHFDDDRARAAFGVLGELAERVQILFFTHHARDLTLAASAIAAPRLFRHGLAGPLAHDSHENE